MVRFGPSRVHQVPRRGRCPLCGYPSINLHHCYFKKSGNRNKTSLEWITETVEANTDGFKPRTHQVDALQALALRGDDAVLVFPTNAGKSLIYQIWPFLYVKGIVVVISPLIIIMEDQLMELNAQERFNYAKTTISNVRIVATHVTKETSANVLKNVNKGTLRVVYATAEYAISEDGCKLWGSIAKGVGILGWMVDEADKCPGWGLKTLSGPAFRPAYSKLGKLRVHQRSAPLGICTATITQSDLVTTESLCNIEAKSVTRLVESLDRPNVIISFRKFKGLFEPRLVRQMLKVSGLSALTTLTPIAVGRLEREIFDGKTKQKTREERTRSVVAKVVEQEAAEDAALLKKEQKLRAAMGVVMVFVSTKQLPYVLAELKELRPDLNPRHFHSNLASDANDPSVRIKAAAAFVNIVKSGETRCVVVTQVALLGLNISNVRIILAFFTPHIASDGPQILGRGGRDGFECHAIFFHKESTLSFVGVEGLSDTQKGRVMLRDMAMSETCRVMPMLQHFHLDGLPEIPDDFLCTHCDLCLKVDIASTVVAPKLPQLHRTPPNNDLRVRYDAKCNIDVTESIIDIRKQRLVELYAWRARELVAKSTFQASIVASNNVLRRVAKYGPYLMRVSIDRELLILGVLHSNSRSSLAKWIIPQLKKDKMFAMIKDEKSN